jgi:hypothetical protein
MTRRKFDVAEAKVDKCAEAKGLTACPEGCDKWHNCNLMVELCIEGVKASERAIKRLEKLQYGEGRSFLALYDKQNQKKIEDVLTANYRTLDNHAYLLEAVTHENQELDAIVELGKNASDLYHEGKYVILGKDEALGPLVFKN